ncbi:MAG TPA: cell division topological specificity factor MinE [Ktedonobacteraceae bacterium]|jgi:cell division topological specificity factor|nr:cell division topological specificity factor MinE [Ktedonobacteraceae bacterium]
MGVFEFMTGRKKPTPGEVAKERLKVALVHDRLKVNPELLELIKADLIKAISQRLEIDEQHMQVSMAREGRWDKLLADMPVKRQKVAFEWDPPAYTPTSNALQGNRIRVEVERLDRD